ncbi:MAG TPA: hypothetical protein VLM85_12565 [Polyangiaceae bacterium]|nr:hypothetical protein [Polyangiaceae bacterium]
MRKLHVLLLSVSVLSLAAAAAAQDQPPAPAPTPSASASASTAAPPATTTPPPPATTTAPAPPPPPSAAVKQEDEQEPLRLGRLIETEAERAHARRVGGSAIGMVTGAGVIASGALLIAVGTPPGVDSTPTDTIGVITMALGGVQILTNVISLFVTAPMERLFDAYAPIAIDKDLAPGERVRRGEVLLGSMAEAERGRRTTEAATNLALGIIEAGFAVVFAADDQIIFTTDTQTNNLFRAAFAVGFGVGAFSTIGQAIAGWLWERGPAEIAWEHWQASHGAVTVHTESKLELRPVFTPMLGGGTAGLKLRF